jgi:hypothetical protein
MASSLLLSDLASAQLGIAKPLCYGPVAFRGNVLRTQRLSNNSQVQFIAGGEGEWGGLDRIWLNGKLIDITDTALVHFHAGTETPIGAGLAPTSLGGDQLVDQFWTYFPADQQRLTFSGLAYVGLMIAPDPQAPSATPDWLIHARGCKVRSFDATGAQLAYAYSTNYAWILLDLYLRSYLKVDALKGDALTAGEKARIDFVAVADAAAYCDAVLAGGQKRFEGGFTFTQRTTLAQASAQICRAGQLFTTDVGGILTIRADKPRASSFRLTRAMIAPATAKFHEGTLRSATNRFNANFRDSKARKIVGITSAQRTANVVTITTDTTHPFFTNDDIELVGILDPSFNIVVPTPTILSNTTLDFGQTAPDASSSGGYVGTPESRFAVRAITLDHDAHQAAVAQRGPGLAPSFKRTAEDIDLGVCSANQVQRVLQFLSRRTLGLDQTPYKAPVEFDVTANYYAYDPVSGVMLCELIAGDVLTVDKSISEEFAGDYELVDNNKAPLTPSDGNGAFGKMSLKCLEYVPGAFSDVAPVDPDTVAPFPARKLDAPFVLGSDGMKPILNSRLGSVPLSFSGSIAFSVTTSSIQWAPNIQVSRTDTGMAIDTINTTQNVTGLSAATLYNHYPFIDDRNGSVFDMVRTGGTGTPTWAHIGTSNAWTQEQARADHAALSGVPLAASTTASGTGSGSGGGDGACCRVRTLGEHKDLGKVELQNFRPKEKILGPGGKWRTVKSVELYENNIWIRVRTQSGEWQDVTPGHRFSSIDGELLKASSMGLESILGGRNGAEFLEEISVVRELDYAVKLELEPDEELGEDAHLYYAGMVEPRIENHNIGRIEPC